MNVSRVLIAKPGLDGYDRGAKVMARFLREHSCEVIYTGLHQSLEQIVCAAEQEAVDAGSHGFACAEVLRLLRTRGGSEVAVFAGGTIPEKSISALVAIGVKAVIRPRTSLEAGLGAFREHLVA